MKYCENCGCKVFNGKYVNCHEELFILEQYEELNMPLPDDDTEFMQNVYKQQIEVENNKTT